MTGMELKILDWLQTIRTPIGDALMCFITSLGNVGAIWIVLAVVLIAIPKTRKSGIIVAAALIIDAVLCSGILKNVFCRIRPFDVNTAIQVLIIKPRDFSFPSGHTSASFAAATALWQKSENYLSWHSCLPAWSLFQECICMYIIQRILLVVFLLVSHRPILPIGVRRKSRQYAETVRN